MLKLTDSGKLWLGKAEQPPQNHHRTAHQPRAQRALAIDYQREGSTWVPEKTHCEHSTESHDNP